MNIEQIRFNMIEQQIRPWGIHDLKVLQLFKHVKREQFVPEPYKNIALADLNVPLPNQQTMLTPKVEARILQSLQIQKNETILEIGAGSGFLSVLFAKLGHFVTALEIHPTLVQYAQASIAHAKMKNIQVIEQNGWDGYPKAAPFDIIFIGASVPEIPKPLLDQLAKHGRLFAFVGKKPVIHATLVKRIDHNEFESEILFETDILPLENMPSQTTFDF